MRVQTRGVYCDRCIAQAQEIFSGDVGVLMFCGHHAAQYREALNGLGFYATRIAEGAPVEVPVEV